MCIASQFATEHVQLTHKSMLSSREHCSRLVVICPTLLANRKGISLLRFLYILKCVIFIEIKAIRYCSIYWMSTTAPSQKLRGHNFIFIEIWGVGCKTSVFHQEEDRITLVYTLKEWCHCRLKIWVYIPLSLIIIRISLSLWLRKIPMQIILHRK